jgi:hypothetical protein
MGEPPNEILSSPEPVGSSLPKFTVNTDGLRMSSRAGGMLSLLCPAQAHPVPSMRLVAELAQTKFAPVSLFTVIHGFKQELEVLKGTKFTSFSKIFLFPCICKFFHTKAKNYPVQKNKSMNVVHTVHIKNGCKY